MVTDEAPGIRLAVGGTVMAGLGDRVRERIGNDGGPLNIMYRIDGSSDLKEDTLDHWTGYRGSSPVRIGNGAAEQLQLDIYGEALDSLYAAERPGCRSPTGGGRRSAVSWTGSRTTGTRPRKESGRPAAADSRSPTAG
jgi:hypothetical protein